MTIYQPKSLVQRAAEIASTEVSKRTAHNAALPLAKKKKGYDMDWMVQHLPAEIQTKLMIHFKASDLVAFLDAHKSIEHYKQFCQNDDNFQRFLFHFFMQLELDSTNGNIEKKLTAHWLKFQKYLKEKNLFLVNEKTNTPVKINVNSFDFATRSMGFDKPTVVQNLPAVTFFETFFLIKFFLDHSFYRLPNPTLPPSVSAVVPTIPDYSFDNGYFHPRHVSGAQPQWYPEFKKEPKKLSEQFFFRLSAMAHCLENFAHQEVLVYASQLLETNLYYQSPFLREFYCHVWGMLAVTLAQMNLKQVLIFSCLVQMDKSVRIQSHKWDVLMYRQRVAAILGWQLKENEIFRIFFYNVPRTSHFFRQSLKIHFNSMLQQIETLTMQLYILYKRNETAMLKIRSVSLTRAIDNLRKILHVVFSKKSFSQENNHSIFQYFALIDLAALLIEKIQGTCSSDTQNDTLSKCAISLKNCEHHIEYFLDHYYKNTPYSRVEDDLDDCHDWIKVRSRAENPIIWSHALFSYVLPVKLFDQFHNQAYQLARDAMEIYQKMNHYRTALLKDYIAASTMISGAIVEPRTFTFPTFTSQTIDNFDFFMLLRMEPLLKHMISFGVKSVIDNDIVP